MASERKVLIMGGGLGGLFTGAFLAREGLRVVVVEQNTEAGGGLQTFKRRGVSYGTGMHLVGGFGEGGTLHRICSYLGILDRLKLRPVDKLASVVLPDGSRYILPTDQDERLHYLTTLFPHEVKGLYLYSLALQRIALKIDTFNLRAGTGTAIDYKPSMVMPYDKFIAHYITDRKLRMLLAYTRLLYDGQPGKTPTYLHAVVTRLFAGSSAMFVDGSHQLADALTGVIESCGGEVRTGRRVVTVRYQPDMGIVGVETIATHEAETTATRVLDTADCYISAIDPCALLRLLPPGTFNRALTRRLQTMPHTRSAFKAYYKLRPHTLPTIGHPCYVWGHTERDTMIYLTPPTASDEDYASTLEVICPMDWDEVSRWADTHTGRRGKTYERWKQRRLDHITARMERLIPDFKDCIEEAFAASPLTLRDYLGAEQGAMYGYAKSGNDPALSQLSVRTKISNLWLTGQCVHLHGICGVPLTAIETAEAIVGRGRIIDKIGAVAPPPPHHWSKI